MDVPHYTECTISEEDTFEVLEKYFSSTSMADFQKKSFNDLISTSLQRIVTGEPDVKVVKKNILYTIKYGQVHTERPSLITDKKTRPIYPHEARLRDETYAAPISVDTILSVKDLETGEVTETYHPKLTIGYLPVMLFSNLCNLHNKTAEELVSLGEEAGDCGGYFIIKGKEKSLISQQRDAYDKVKIYKDKGGNGHYAEIRSMSLETGHSIMTQASMSIEGKITFSLPYIDNKSVPVGIVFKALGFGASVGELIYQGRNSLPDVNCFVPDDTFFATEDEYIEHQREIVDMVDMAFQRIVLNISKDSETIKTENEALDYLGKFSIHDIDEDRQRDYAKQALRELLPHMGSFLPASHIAVFLGRMIKKLILTALGVRMCDDRDGMSNKRIDDSGSLIADLLRLALKRHNKKVAIIAQKSPDIISGIRKITIISKTIIYCFAKGSWGIQKASYVKQGVSQCLSRLSHSAAISQLRRIAIQVEKESKNVAIRQITLSQIGMKCPTSTPEGKQAGIVTSLSVTATITIRVPSVVMKMIIQKSGVVELFDDSLVMEDTLLRTCSKKDVYLNGIYMGFCEDEGETVGHFRRLRSSGTIPYDVSIYYDEIDQKVVLLGDEGRMIRPLFKVIEGAIPSVKGLSWDELLLREIVVYRDTAELETSVIAMYPGEIEMLEADYCEIHPSTMLDICASMIPFPDHNQAPRNTYQCLWEEEPVLMADGTRKMIRNIEVGDEVITFDPKTLEISTTKVIYQHVSPTEKTMVKVRTISGREITVTADHLIMTRDGWKEAGSLTGSDTVGICLNQSVEQAYEKPDMLNLERRSNIVYVPIESVVEVPNVLISDITTESENHSFIGGQGFCVHNSAMSKQAIGIYHKAFNVRADTVSHILHYPQTSIVSTDASRMTGMDSKPYGINAVVAIINYTGFNQEDSIIMNQSAVERGLFVSTTYKTITEERKKSEKNSYERIQIPPRELQKMSYCYYKLGKDGVIKPGSIVVEGDVLVGKVRTTQVDGRDELRDVSRVVRSGEEGVVDTVFATTNPGGHPLYKIKIRTIRIPEIGDKCACYDDSHDVLTSKGWINIKDVEVGMLVASLNDGTMSYEPIVAVQEYDYDGDMYVLDTGKVSLRVTPNHRLYVSDHTGTGKYKIVPAEDAYKKPQKYLKCADRRINIRDDFPEQLVVDEDGEITHYTVYDKEGEVFGVYDIDAWLTIVGVWLAEGVMSNTRIDITVNKQRVKDALTAAAETMGVKFSKYRSSKDSKERDSWSINSEPIGLEFTKFKEISIRKYIPDWAWFLNKRQSQVLLDSMILGDGCYIGGTDTVRYSTSSIRLRDDVQRLALHAGCSADYHLKSKKGFSHYMYNARGNPLPEPNKITTNTDHWTITIVTTQCWPLVNKNYSLKRDEGNQDRMEPYSGKVYCLTVGKRLRGDESKVQKHRKMNNEQKRYTKKLKCLEARWQSEENSSLDSDCEGTMDIALESIDTVVESEGIIYVRRNGLAVWCGQSKSAQKGTIGALYRQEDMPFSIETGMSPDLLINSLCMPSRMTVSHLMETVLGKECAINGKMGRATPFSSASTDNADLIIHSLQECGFEGTGYETMCSGFTGEMFQARIFVGITHYQKLKHMVADKMHARAFGNVQCLSRQPEEGRSRNGGLRYGEMEVCATAVHGISLFLKQRMFDMSDKFTVFLCDDCGMIVNNPAVCSLCGSSTIKETFIPYAFKLLLQNLGALCLKTEVYPE